MDFLITLIYFEICYGKPWQVISSLFVSYIISSYDYSICSLIIICRNYAIWLDELEVTNIKLCNYEYRIHVGFHIGFWMYDSCWIQLKNTKCHFCDMISGSVKIAICERECSHTPELSKYLYVVCTILKVHSFIKKQK